MRRNPISRRGTSGNPDVLSRLGIAFLSFVLMVVVASPILVLLSRSLQGPHPEIVVSDDLAVAELYTLRASRGQQLVGSYSRFRFHHPGPAQFYFLAPFYRLLGNKHIALNIGALVSSLTFLFVLLCVAMSTGGARGLAFSAVPLALLVLYLQPFLLWNIWNPYFAILPFAASAACSYACCTGKWRFLPVGVVAGSLAAQCHFVTVLPLCAVWGAAFLVAVYGLKRRALHLPRPPVVFITIGLSLGLWAPVAFEQAVGKPGNLTAVTGFIGDNPGQVVVGDSARAGLIAISECFLSPIGIGGQVRPEGLNQLVCISLTLILMAIFVATLYNRLRKREPQSIAAFACGSALLTGSFITLAIMSDPLHPYLNRWVVTLGPLLVLMMATVFTKQGAPSSPLKIPRIVISVLVTLTLSLIASISFARQPSLPAWINSGWGPAAYGGDVWRPTKRALERAAITQPRIRISSPKSWPYAAALVLQFEKLGITVTVDQNWGFMFGHHLTEGDDDGLIMVGDREDTRLIRGSPGLHVGDASVRIDVLPLDEEWVGCQGMGDRSIELYLRKGFYPAKFPGKVPPFRWSRGRDSEIVVPLIKNRPYKMSIRCAPFPPAEPQTISVLVNGQEISEHSLHKGWQTVAINIPGEIVQEKNGIALLYSHVASPAEFGNFRDTRKLAVQFREICFDAYESESPDP